MQYNLAEMSAEMMMDYSDIIRMIRNEKLSDSDWTQLPDAPLSAEKKQEWLAYRAYLRDYPLQFVGLEHYPDVITFNTQP
jgi:hypothetical protein